MKLRLKMPPGNARASLASMARSKRTPILVAAATSLSDKPRSRRARASASPHSTVATRCSHCKKPAGQRPARAHPSRVITWVHGGRTRVIKFAKRRATPKLEEAPVSRRRAPPGAVGGERRGRAPRGELQIAAGEMAHGDPQGQAEINARVGQHQAARRGTGVEGRKADRAQQRRLHLEDRAPP